MKTYTYTIMRSLLLVTTIMLAGVEAEAQRDTSIQATGGAIRRVKGEYRLNIGDRLEISVLGENDLQRTVTVLPDGKIAYVLIGQVQAEGLTLDELKNEVREHLTEWYNSPLVSIIPVQLVIQTSTVTVRGGGIPSENTYQIGRDDTIMSVVARAGDLVYDASNRPTADFSRASLTRDGKILEVDFRALLVDNDTTQDRVLQHGDTIFVPSLSHSYVTIVGAVGKSGRQQITSGMRILGALGQTDWLTYDEKGQLRANLKKAYIKRDGKRLEDVDFVKLIRDHSETYNIELQDGDFIHLPEAGIAAGSASILGIVKIPGSKFIDQDAKIMDLVAAAGGLMYGAANELLVDTENAYLSRNGVPVEVDFARLLGQNDLTADIPIQDGDLLVLPPVSEGYVSVMGAVAGPGRLLLHEGDTLMEILTKAGGAEMGENNEPMIDYDKAYLFRDGGYVDVDFAALIGEGSMDANIPAKSGDFLFLPLGQPKHVTVIGAVSDPGQKLINRGDRVLDILAKAGWAKVAEDSDLGFLGDLSSTVLLRDNAILDVRFDGLPQDKSQNMTVMEGDVIYVPEAALKQVFVVGEVKAELAIPFNRPITLVEALTQAGGVTPKGRRAGKVYIVKNSMSDKPEYIKRDLHNLYYGKATENMQLEPNDIVFVPETALSVLSRYSGYLSSVIGLILQADTLNSTIINPVP